MRHELTPYAPLGDEHLRPAVQSEFDALARLWFDGWRDAHASLVPEGLVRARTPESFAQRLEVALTGARVVGAVGAPVGFYMLRGDELYQLYVAEEGRGKGVAAMLIADAERQLAASGVETGWLDCAIGNERAARFYEKSGWTRVGAVVSRLETASGSFDVDVWRYEKHLA